MKTESLEDLTNQLFALDNEHVTRYVSLGNEASVLFKLTIKGNNADIELTGFGKRIFNTTSDKLRDVEPFVLMNYLGVQAENRQNLTKLIRDNGDDRISALSVLNYCENNGKFIISKNKSQINIKHDQRNSEIPTRSVIAGKLNKADIESIISSNVTRSNATRSIASVYLKNSNKLVPYMVKFNNLSSNDNSTLVYEHAALKALKDNGVKTVESSIFKGDKGNIYLLTKSFDKSDLNIEHQSGNKFFVSSGNTKYFSSSSWARIVSSGDNIVRDSKQSLEYILSKAIDKSDALKNIITLHCFNVMIGNSDTQGYNNGTIFSINENGLLSESLCPAYDITPVMMTTHDESDKRSYVSESLNGITIDDCFNSNRISSNLLARIEMEHPKLIEGCFSAAKKCKLDMVNHINSSCVENGYITRIEAEKFKGYLEEKLSSTSDSASLSSDPFKSHVISNLNNTSAKDNFVKKVRDKELNREIALQ